jgi:hypothetical protein
MDQNIGSIWGSWLMFSRPPWHFLEGSVHPLKIWVFFDNITKKPYFIWIYQECFKESRLDDCFKSWSIDISGFQSLKLNLKRWRPFFLADVDVVNDQEKY